MWDLNSGSCTRTFKGYHAGICNIILFKEDVISTVSDDNDVKFLNTKDGK